MSTGGGSSASGTLSQGEIDRLLGGSGALPAPDSRTADDAAVQVYDFRRPHRVSKERLRTLEAMYERMVKAVESWVIGRVRGQIEMRLVSVEQFSFGEFTLSLPTPCASFIFDIADSGGQQGFVDIGHEFAFYLVDKLFGGGGEQIPVPRPLTRVERMAVRGVAERVAVQLREIWADHIPLALEISSFESFPDILLQSANRDDPVLVANIEVAAGESSSLMLVCLPFGVLDKFFTHATKRRVNGATGSEQERAVNRVIAEQSLRATRVTVAARLPEFRMTMRDIAALSEGGVISTGLAHDTQLRVLVGSQERFAGTPGRVAQRLAVRLDGMLSDARDSGVTGSVQFDPAVLADPEPQPQAVSLSQTI